MLHSGSTFGIGWDLNNQTSCIRHGKVFAVQPCLFLLLYHDQYWCVPWDGLLGTVLGEGKTYNLDTPFTSIYPVPSRQRVKVPAQPLHLPKCPQAPRNPVYYRKACHSSAYKYKISIHSLMMESPDSINLWHSVDNQSRCVITYYYYMSFTRSLR